MRIGNSLRNTVLDRATAAQHHSIVRIRAPVRLGAFKVSKSTVADIRYDVSWKNQKPIIGNVNITFTPTITTGEAKLFGIHVAKDGTVHAESDSQFRPFPRRLDLETLLTEIGVVLDEATTQIVPHRDATATPSLDKFGIRAWTVSSVDTDLFVGDLT